MVVYHEWWYTIGGTPYKAVGHTQRGYDSGQLLPGDAKALTAVCQPPAVSWAVANCGSGRVTAGNAIAGARCPDDPAGWIAEVIGQVTRGHRRRQPRSLAQDLHSNLFVNKPHL